MERNESDVVEHSANADGPRSTSILATLLDEAEKPVLLPARNGGGPAADPGGAPGDEPGAEVQPVRRVRPAAFD
jgi:hypothetical protein